MRSLVTLGVVAFALVWQCTGRAEAACIPCATGFERVGDACLDVATDHWLAGMNPTGNWSYRYARASATNGSTFDNFSMNADGIARWQDNTEVPILTFNPGAVPIVIDGSTTFAPGQMGLHPGPNGDTAGLRWTAPAAGTYGITVDVVGMSGLNASPVTTTRCYVKHGAATLGTLNVNVASGMNGMNSTTFMTSISLASAGESVDFIVDDGGNGYAYDTTGIEVVITQQAGAPATDGGMPLGGGGMLAGGGGASGGGMPSGGGGGPSGGGRGASTPDGGILSGETDAEVVSTAAGSLGEIPQVKDDTAARSDSGCSVAQRVCGGSRGGQWALFGLAVAWRLRRRRGVRRASSRAASSAFAALLRSVAVVALALVGTACEEAKEQPFRIFFQSDEVSLGENTLQFVDETTAESVETPRWVGASLEWTGDEGNGGTWNDSYRLTLVTADSEGSVLHPGPRWLRIDLRSSAGEGQFNLDPMASSGGYRGTVTYVDTDDAAKSQESERVEGVSRGKSWVDAEGYFNLTELEENVVENGPDSGATEGAVSMEIDFNGVVFDLGTKVSMRGKLSLMASHGKPASHGEPSSNSRCPEASSGTIVDGPCSGRNGGDSDVKSITDELGAAAPGSYRQPWTTVRFQNLGKKPIRLEWFEVFDGVNTEIGLEAFLGERVEVLSASTLHNVIFYIGLAPLEFGTDPWRKLMAMLPTIEHAEDWRYYPSAFNVQPEDDQKQMKYSFCLEYRIFTGAKSELAQACGNYVGPVPEIAAPEDCANNVDDDADGQVDCVDNDCYGSSSCTGSAGTGGGTAGDGSTGGSSGGGAGSGGTTGAKVKTFGEAVSEWMTQGVPIVTVDPTKSVAPESAQPVTLMIPLVFGQEYFYDRGSSGPRQAFVFAADGTGKFTSSDPTDGSMSTDTIVWVAQADSTGAAMLGPVTDCTPCGNAYQIWYITASHSPGSSPKVGTADEMQLLPNPSTPSDKDKLFWHSLTLGR